MLFLATSVFHLFVEPYAASAVAGQTEAITSPRLPFQASVESVIDRGSIEGHPVTVVRFRSRVSYADALIATERAWRGTGASVVSTQAGPWRVVSRYEIDRFGTLQLRPSRDGGTEGLFSIWSGPGLASAPASASAQPAQSAPDPAGLLPAGARVLRSLDGIDAGRRHRTLVALAEGSPAWVAQALESRITAQGFARDAVARAPAQPAAVGEARLYRAAGRTLGLTVHPHDGHAAIVIHLTETQR